MSGPSRFLVLLLFVAASVASAQEYAIAYCDLSGGGSLMSTYGVAQLQGAPFSGTGHSLSGTHYVADQASFNVVIWNPFYNGGCMQAVFNQGPTCTYQKTLIGSGAAGRCYRASISATAANEAGTTISSAYFNSSMYCIDPPPPPEQPCNDGGKPPTSIGTIEEDSGRDAASAERLSRRPIAPQGTGGCGASPIVIDLDGEGFPLSDDPVTFDIKGDGHPLRMYWTARGSRVAFLALDRNGNGVIDNGQELFGNFTRLTTGEAATYGYIALAEFDLAANGGNFDGHIGPEDRVWSSLRLWIDANHDGICQPDELMTLDDAGILQLDYDYSITWKKDRYGNLFRAKSKGERANRQGRPKEIKTYDVFFKVVS